MEGFVSVGSIVGIVVIIVGILASVALHEVGHMLPAKKFGVLVPDYAVGFGPALWKKKIGDTTYALRAILLGGYVKIVGMYAPARPGTRRPASSRHRCDAHRPQPAPRAPWRVAMPRRDKQGQ